MTLPVANPVTLPVAEIVALVRSRLAQIVALWVVRSLVVLSEYRPVRCKSVRLPAATDGVRSTMVTDSRVAGVTVRVVLSV